MAPSRISQLDLPEVSRPAKRLKDLDSAENVENDAADDFELLPPHPLGIKPEGNSYADLEGLDGRRSHIRQHAGYFARLPDELLMHFLDYLDPHQLLALGSSCKALYAFTHVDELWRAHFVNRTVDHFSWLNSWRSTYWQLPKAVESHVSCAGLYSDVLHRPFFCTYTSLTKYARGIPKTNEIARLSDLTYDKYSSEWADKPFVLTQPVREWPVFNNWTTECFQKDYQNVPFRAEAVDWPLSTYMTYMQSHTDESPLYLFDCSFAEKMNINIGKNEPNAAYWPPECFGEDLFGLLGDQRPDCRWLIMGPSRSGSTFHKDPNATSAWNAVLTGSKYWLMFPSGPNIPPPPGVILSEDASEITSPQSIAEYLLSFHEIARSTPGCREGICYAGEVLHVPSGWFHLVLNLEESIALTQNFVPRKRLADVLRFLKDSPDQVSGFKDDVADPYGLFVERLRKVHPELLDNALKELEIASQVKLSKWDKIIKAVEKDEPGGSFNFGFGGDEYSDDE